MPYGCHIYSKESGTAKATLCEYTQSDHALPHWWCVFRCCAECPCINIPDQEIKITKDVTFNKKNKKWELTQSCSDALYLTFSP